MHPNRIALTYLYSRLPFLIRRAEQLATTIYAAQPNGMGLTLMQLQLLLVLDEAGSIPQADLARLAGSDTSTTSFVLQNLAKRGLIARGIDPGDKRRKLTQLTPAGRESLAGGHAALLETHRLLLAPVENDVDRLGALMSAIADTQLARSTSPQLETLPHRDGLGTNAISESPAFLLRRALQVMDAIASDEFTSLGITIRQFAAMFVIFSHPGIGEADLIRYAGFEASNASFLVRLLCKNGLVEQLSAPARTRKQYRIATAGWDMMHRAGPALVRAERIMLSALEPTEIDELRRLLAQLIAGHNLGEQAAMPLFHTLSSTLEWPIKAGEVDFETIASVPRDKDAPVDVNGYAPTLKIPPGLHERQGILQLVKWAELSVRSEIERLLGPLGITPGQLLALGVIGDVPGLTASDLARLLGLAPQSMTSLLQPLEISGLVARHPDPANIRRRPLTILTPGQRLLEAAHEAIAPLEARLLAGLVPAQRNLLRQGLLALLAGDR